MSAGEVASDSTQRYRRIAVEEAFAPPEMLQLYREMIDRGDTDDPGFVALWSFFLKRGIDYTERIVARLQDLGAQRLADMDATGIVLQVISLTAPGVQVFDSATATSLARLANDRLAEAVRRHPDRFAGLAAMAPQDPQSAAKEIERAVRTLGMKGVILNSHVRGEYLDDPKYWDIFAAAEAVNAPIYLHPATPSPSMIRPYLEPGLEGAIWGFAAETGLHMLRIIVSGVFDRFPRLRFVIGHLGEGLPFWLFRLDHMQDAVLANRGQNRLRRKISEYMRENVYVTTSGMAWEPAILFCHAVLGADRVLYAMDYPYQFVPEEVQVTDRLPLSDADKKKLYQSNAEAVFSL